MVHLSEAEERVFRECVRDVLAGAGRRACSYRRQWLKLRLDRGLRGAFWGLAVGGFAAAALMACMTPGGARFIANFPRRINEVKGAA